MKWTNRKSVVGHVQTGDLLMDASGARFAGWVFVGFRAFFTAVVDMPELGNAYAIASLLGGALAMLPALCLWRLVAAHPEGTFLDTLTAIGSRPCAVVYSVLVGVLLLFDAAAGVEALVGSASYVALRSLPTPFVLIPTCLALAITCLCGARAVGGVTRMYALLMSVLLVIVLIVQWSDFQPRWLLPLFGPGAPVLLTDGFRLGGLFSLTTVLYWGLDVKPDTRGLYAVRLIPITVAVVTVLVACFCMMTAALPGAPTSRFLRYDMLLSNGRTSLSLQMLLTPIWFGGLFLGSAVELTLFVRILRALFPQFPAWGGTAIGTAALFVLTLFSCVEPAVLGFAETLYYPILLIPALYFLLRLFIRKGRHA